MNVLAAAIISLVFILPAAAQDKPVATSENTVSDQEALDQCRAAALAKGLDGEARKKAISACVVEAAPKIASRFHCLMDPKLKTLDQEARLLAIEDCVKGKP